LHLNEGDIESLRTIFGIAKEFGLKRIRVGHIEAEFGPAPVSDEPTGPIDFKLPPEAAPPEGDALLYYSTPLAPTMEDENKTGV